MAVKLKRNTTALPAELLQAMIDFAADGWDLGRVTATVRNRSDGYATGHAYPESRRVRIHISAPVESFDARARDYKRKPFHLPTTGGNFYPHSLDEVVLYVIAHEVRHIIQGRYKRYGRTWGSRGKYPERDAEAFGVRIVRAWRRRADT